jgi:hypothetical protein
MDIGMHASALAYARVCSEPRSGHCTSRLASSASLAPPRLASLALAHVLYVHVLYLRALA